MNSWKVIARQRTYIYDSDLRVFLFFFLKRIAKFSKVAKWDISYSIGGRPSRKIFLSYTHTRSFVIITRDVQLYESYFILFHKIADIKKNIGDVIVMIRVGFCHSTCTTLSLTFYTRIFLILWTTKFRFSCFALVFISVSFRFVGNTLFFDKKAQSTRIRQKYLFDYQRIRLLFEILERDSII